MARSVVRAESALDIVDRPAIRAVWGPQISREQPSLIGGHGVTSGDHHVMVPEESDHIFNPEDDPRV
ncbi:MAG: hypothetical protein WBB22_09595 [Anaerolineae bacterium]